MSRPLPADLLRAVESCCGSRVVGASGVGGGCISTTLALRLEDGSRLFAKLAPAEPPGGALLAAEADGLAALRATGTVRVPAVVAAGPGWLLLEWLEPGRGTDAQWERLGAALAALHAAPVSGWGFESDNFIGTLPQANPATADWADFWWQARLLPQLYRARTAGAIDGETQRAFEQLADALPAVLAPAAEEGPSLLHGDLWSGNIQLVHEGEPAVLDPAAYRGHREVDLAMASLFGGFDAAFWEAYHAARPLRPDGLERRRAVYQLYYLLVHVNLFGTGYLPRTRAALRTALGRPGSVSRRSGRA